MCDSTGLTHFINSYPKHKALLLPPDVFGFEAVNTRVSDAFYYLHALINFLWSQSPAPCKLNSEHYSII